MYVAKRHGIAIRQSKLTTGVGSGEVLANPKQYADLDIVLLQYL